MNERSQGQKGIRHAIFVMTGTVPEARISSFNDILIIQCI